MTYLSFIEPPQASVWLIMTDLLNVGLVVTSGLEWPPVALLPPLNKAETERFMRHVWDEIEVERMSRDSRYKLNGSSYILAWWESEYGFETSIARCKRTGSEDCSYSGVTSGQSWGWRTDPEVTVQDVYYRVVSHSQFRKS